MQVNIVGHSAGNRLQLLLNSAFTQAEDKESSLKMPNVPKHQASFWMRYEFTDGAMEGFYFAGGLLYMGKRPAGNDSNLFYQGWKSDADAYLTTDVFPGKTFTFNRVNFTVSLNVSNSTTNF